MKALFNRPEDAVTDALSGLVATSPHLARLDGFPSLKVVYDLEFNGDSTVAVISGGGSGHEPAFAGFVGAGMLAAAVAGDVFAAPPEEAVLAAIRQVTGAAGCLVILLNYTGDRLNFWAAAERAKVEGLRVTVVAVADDCALPGKAAVGRRGIAGAALVLKLAGAAAARGASLDEVAAAAEAASGSVGTMGCSLTACNLPGRPPSERLGPEEMELGLGIHGEPGASRVKVCTVREVVDVLVGTIAGEGGASPAAGCYLPVRAGQRVVLLVNNLGCSTTMEMDIAAGEAVRAVTQRLRATVERIFVGHFVTSLDMHGLSVSLMRLPERESEASAWMAALDAATAAPAWQRRAGRFVPGKIPAPVPRGPTDAAGFLASAAPSAHQLTEAEAAAAVALARRIQAACLALEGAEAELNALDAAVGDGDCGSTMATGAAAVHAALGVLPLHDPGATALAVAQLLGTSMGGTSGGLWKIFFVAAAAELANRPGPLSVDGAAAALQAGAAAVSKCGGAVAGSRTMLDALLPASAALRSASAGGASGAAAARAAADAARTGAEGTAAMAAAAAGRSAYVPASALEGVRDPGAAAVAKWMAAVAEAMQ